MNLKLVMIFCPADFVMFKYSFFLFFGCGWKFKLIIKVVDIEILLDYYVGHLYVKSDVYGFGVVLVEILTGLRALDSNRPSGQHKLTEWVKPYLHDRRKLKGIMDSRLEGKFPSKAAFRIAQLSMKCLASEPKHRPSMKDVLENLERIQAANEKPVEPKFRSTHAASRQGHQAVHHRSPRQDGSN